MQLEYLLILPFLSIVFVVCRENAYNFIDTMHSIFSYIWLYFSSLTAGECSIQLFLSTISLNSYILLVCRATPNENVCNLLIIHQQCICVYAGEIIFLFCWNKKKNFTFEKATIWLTGRCLILITHIFAYEWYVCIAEERQTSERKWAKKKEIFLYVKTYLF